MSVAQAVAERPEGPGLVSLPTSGTPAGCKRDGDEIRYLVPSDFFGPQVEQVRLSRLRRSVGASARLHDLPSVGHRKARVCMLTLTYRNGDEWQPRHIADLMRHVRQWCARRGDRIRYVWVAELQQRGAIHYHIAIWLPKGVMLPKPDKRGWWPHGMTRIEVARHAVAYLMKYLSKGSHAGLRGFPRGARIYGVGGLDLAGRRIARWLGWPSMLKGNFDVNDDCRRAEGGGWITPLGHMASEFIATLHREGVRIARVLTQPRSIEADGAFCWMRG